MTSGIYQIVINGKKYIGSSFRIERRWSEHKRLLLKGTHTNKHLQHAYDKYGEVEYSIVCLCDKQDLASLEQELIGLFNTLDSSCGYNISAHTTAPMLGRKHSSESKLAMSKAHAGKPRVLSEEGRERLRRARFSRRDEQAGIARQMGIANKGRVPWNKGKPMSQEQRSALSAAKTGKPRNLTAEQLAVMANKVRCARIGTKLIDGHFVKFS